MSSIKYLFALVAISIASIGACSSTYLKLSSQQYKSIYRSISQNDVNSLRSWLNKGLNVNERFEGGYTLLHFSVILKADKCLVLLVKHKADVNARTNMTAFTPMHFAAMKGNSYAVKILIAYRAVKDLHSDDGSTALDIAKTKKNEAIIRLLQP